MAITLAIDGKLTWGHTYDKYITPGRRTLIVSPNRRFWDPWQAILDVRRGQTYSYIAAFNVNKLVLTPVTGSR